MPVLPADAELVPAVELVVDGPGAPLGVPLVEPQDAVGAGEVEADVTPAAGVEVGSEPELLAAEEEDAGEVTPAGAEVPGAVQPAPVDDPVVAVPVLVVVAPDRPCRFTAVPPVPTTAVVVAEPVAAFVVGE